MQERTGIEKGGRRLNARSAIALVGSIAVAGAIGVVVSSRHHDPALLRHPSQAPVSPRPVTTSPVSLQPQAGAGISLADDLATHEVVLFGGVGDYANTWLWNGSVWARAQPPASPAGRFGASEAYDPQTKTVMLFGGRLEPGTPVHDTWAWNGSTWTPIDSGAGGPEPGEGSDMAWDPAIDQMVLLTRSGVISEPAQTWIWAGTHWTQPSDGALPAGATYSPMWFDPVTRSLLAVGCCVGPPPSTGAVNTTWRWSGSSWTLLPPTIGAPVDGSTMALDPALDRLVLCACAATPSAGIELWDWDGHEWASLPAAPLPVAAGVEVTAGAQLLVFGAPKSPPQSGEPPVEVWSFTPQSAWVQLGRSP